MQNNKQLIAEILLEIAKNSKTEFIDDAKVDKEMVEVAKKLGIIIPSPDFALFRTVWAEIDKANLNGVRLPRKVVEESLDTFLFKQVNFEHKGAYNMCGITLAVKIIDNRIETINIFYKSLYPDEFEELKEKIKSGEAAVSFEIYNIDPSTKKSVVKDLADGTKEITKMVVHGTGLLLVNPPACPKAKIFSLIAKKEIQEVEKIIDKVFEEDLIFAQLAIEEPKCKNCNTCNCEKEEKIVEEIKIEKVEEKPSEEAKERLCPECKQPLKDEEKELCAECLKKKETNKSSEETKTEAETKPVDSGAETQPKVEETKEEVVVEIPKEEANIVTTTQEIIRVDETKPEGEVITTEMKTETIVVNDEGKEITKVEEESKTVVTYTYEQLEEKVQEAKVELQKIVEEKDKEIEALNAEISKIKTEKEQEIAQLKTELEKKTQEIEKATAEDNNTDNLTVGTVEVKEKVREEQKQITEKAYPKR